MSRILMISELQRLSLDELYALYRETYRTLKQAHAGSEAARNARQNLDTVIAVIHARRAAPPRPPGF